MPILGVLLFAIDIAFVVHAARSGRFSPWGYIILMVPGFGALAYALVELLPEMRGTPGGARAEAAVRRRLDPTKRYRALQNAVEIADTVANRAAFAEECLALNRPDEALEQYEAIVRQPSGDEPVHHVGKARAELAAGRPAGALATLDALQARWPDYRSSSAHLLYARALEEAGRDAEALAEYDAVAEYHAGPEPVVRKAMLLHRLGDPEPARDIAAEVVRRLERGPAFARKQQAEWLTQARALLR